MKLFISLLLLGSFSLFAQTKYSYGNIDMHGGKSDSLTNKNSSFSSMNKNSSSLLFEKSKKEKTSKKQEKKPTSNLK